MGAIASQITGLTIVYSTVYSGAVQRKHQSSVSLAFVRGIHRGPVNFPHKWPVTRKMFDDVIMWQSPSLHLLISILNVKREMWGSSITHDTFSEREREKNIISTRKQNSKPNSTKIIDDDSIKPVCCTNPTLHRSHIPPFCKCIFFTQKYLGYKYFIQIWLMILPKGPIDTMWASVQVMACRATGDKPLLEPMKTPIYRCIYLSLNVVWDFWSVRDPKHIIHIWQLLDIKYNYFFTIIDQI